VKYLIAIISTLLLVNFSSCNQSPKEKAFKAFNQGVSLNLDAFTAQNKGEFEKATVLNKKSIEKFKETLKIDSTHEGARAALAHSLYLDKQYKEAILWFEQANRVNGRMPANCREMGLCRINLGEIQEGKNDIDEAFSIDTSKEIRDITVQDISDIGELAFDYGETYIKEGEVEKGKVYEEFSIGVLMLGFHYDTTKKETALKIAQFADKIGDKQVAEQYRKVGEK
jgi:tetratricopeptide (TPR) repeat protein